MGDKTERDRTYRIRWNVPMDVVVTVTVAADELDAEDDFSIEEYAYDVALDRAKERLDQISTTVNDVAVHGDIDGMEADEVEEVER